jgi:hypothetical protein
MSKKKKAKLLEEQELQAQVETVAVEAEKVANPEVKAPVEKKSDVFYAQLPVCAPQPILKPSKKIQLQPTVFPVAIAPYISFEGDRSVGAESAPTVEAVAVDNTSFDKKKIRIAGVIMAVLTLALLAPYVIVLLAPSSAAFMGKKFIVVVQMLENVDNATVRNSALRSGSCWTIMLCAIALVLNLLKSLVISAVFGKRSGYIFFGLVVFVGFVAYALADFGFANLKNIAKIVENSPSIIFMVAGLVYFIAAIVTSAICPKVNKLDSAEF